MKKCIKVIFKIPFLFIKMVYKMIMWIVKKIFGLLFGLIPDLDEDMSGEEFEEYVKEILVRNGYKNVSLTKRSGDYGVDILAKYKKETYAIQCKLYARPVGVAAVQQAYSGCEYYGYDRAVVVTNNRFTLQAKTLAKNNDVLLWDGEYLNHLKRKANSRSLFKRYKHVQREDEFNHPYSDVLRLLLEEGYASCELLEEHLHYTKEKAYYILDDLEFYELVSCVDELGIRDIDFHSLEEAIDVLSEKV